jgi:hypothetical protein
MMPETHRAEQIRFLSGFISDPDRICWKRSVSSQKAKEAHMKHLWSRKHNGSDFQSVHDPCPMSRSFFGGLWTWLHAFLKSWLLIFSQIYATGSLWRVILTLGGAEFLLCLRKFMSATIGHYDAPSSWRSFLRKALSRSWPPACRSNISRDLIEPNIITWVASQRHEKRTEVKDRPFRHYDIRFAGLIPSYRFAGAIVRNASMHYHLNCKIFELGNALVIIVYGPCSELFRVTGTEWVKSYRLMLRRLSLARLFFLSSVRRQRFRHRNLERHTADGSRV